MRELKYGRNLSRSLSLAPQKFFSLLPLCSVDAFEALSSCEPAKSEPGSCVGEGGPYGNRTTCTV